MTTLVTGATGLLGNNVVRLLLARGEQVRVLARHGSNPKSLEGLNVETAFGDVQDADSIEQAFRGAHRAVHCAAQVHIGWRGLMEQTAINVDGTRHVADAALRCGARLVHVSSVDALGVGDLEHPLNEDSAFDGPVHCPYVETKRQAEQVVRERVAQGLDAVIVNPGFMLGPWDWKPSSGRMLLKIATGWALIAPPGSNTYCDVRDVADGIVSALERGRTGERYVLAGKTLTYMEALRIFARVTGQRPPFRIARKVTLNVIGRVGDLLAKMTGRESDVNSATTAMSMLPKNYSSARAQAELGYRSREVEESASDAWSWLQKYGYVRA